MRGVDGPLKISSILMVKRRCYRCRSSEDRDVTAEELAAAAHTCQLEKLKCVLQQVNVSLVQDRSCGEPGLNPPW